MKLTDSILTFFLVFFVSLNVIQADFPGPLEHPVYRGMPGQPNNAIKVLPNSGYQNLSRRTMKSPTADSDLIDILSSYRLPADSRLYGQYLLLDSIFDLMKSTNYLTEDDKKYIFQIIETNLKKFMIEKIIDTINDIEIINKLSVKNREILFNKTKDAVRTIMYTSNDLNKMYEAMHAWIDDINTEENKKTIGNYSIFGFNNEKHEMFYPGTPWYDLHVTVETKIKMNMFKMYDDEVNRLIEEQKSKPGCWYLWC